MRDLLREAVNEVGVGVGVDGGDVEGGNGDHYDGGGDVDDAGGHQNTDVLDGAGHVGGNGYFCNRYQTRRSL